MNLLIQSCLGVDTVQISDRVLVRGTTFLGKLMCVYEHKLRYGYVPDTDTSTYPVSVLFLKWSTRKSLYFKIKVDYILF
jgi:hypothetical protein